VKNGDRLKPEWVIGISGIRINLAEVDQEFTEEEKNQINAYVLEMGLSLKPYSEYKKQNSELITYFLTSSTEVKKVVFMELYALAIADGLNEMELEFLNEIQSAFDFSDAYKEDVMDWYKTIMPMYNKGFELAGLVRTAA
jgi:hypothetical protein